VKEKKKKEPEEAAYLLQTVCCPGTGDDNGSLNFLPVLTLSLVSSDLCRAVGAE
jgi:hypothetical protein